MPIHAPFWGVFGAHFPQMMSLIVLTPKKDHPWAEPRHLSHTAKIGRAVQAGRVCEKKKNRTGKKSQKGYISPICGEAPTEAMYMKICVVGDVLDVITYAKTVQRYYYCD